MVTQRGPKGWSKPAIAPFSGRWLDLESALAPDGSHLIFVSNRPSEDGGAAIDGRYSGKVQPGNGGRLWRVDRTTRGWSKPYLLPPAVNGSTSIYEPSLATNGDLYFQQAAPDGTRFQLYVARARADGYEAATTLDLGAGPGASDMDPAIARDGSYLVFASDRVAKENQLFISCRTASGWSSPVVLGNELNGAGSVGDPRFGPEQDRLYFVSRRLAPWSGDAARDLTMAQLWNNGLANIWSVPFDAQAYRIQPTR